MVQVVCISPGESISSALAIVPNFDHDMSLEGDWLRENYLASLLLDDRCLSVANFAWKECAFKLVINLTFGVGIAWEKEI